MVASIFLCGPCSLLPIKAFVISIHKPPWTHGKFPHTFEWYQIKCFDHVLLQIGVLWWCRVTTIESFWIPPALVPWCNQARSLRVRNWITGTTLRTDEFFQLACSQHPLEPFVNAWALRHWISSVTETAGVLSGSILVRNVLNNPQRTISYLNTPLIDILRRIKSRQCPTLQLIRFTFSVICSVLIPMIFYLHCHALLCFVTWRLQ